MLIVRGTRSSGLVGSLRWDGKTKGAGPRRRAAPRRDNAGVRARAVGGGQDGEDEQVMSEEVLNRLQEAEREAAELRKQLADLKSDGAEGAASDAGTSGNGKGRLPNRPEVKVDGVSTRENFLYPQSDVWLGETNAEFAQFMAKDGVSESSYQTGVSPEDQGLVTRRLILGIAGTVAVGLLGLIPTEKLDLTSPSQPLFALLVPILEAKDEFPSIEDKVTYAEWSVVQSKVKSILGKPTQLKNTMLQVAKLESDAKRADQMRAYARETADYLSQVDYDQYFDTLIKPSGKQEIEFSQFSLDSLAASKRNLESFLRLVDQEQLEAARNQVDARKAFLAPQQAQTPPVVPDLEEGSGEVTAEEAAMPGESASESTVDTAADSAQVTTL